MLLAYTHDDQEEAVCIRISQPLNFIYACNSSKLIFKISAVVGIQWPATFDGASGVAGRTGDAGRFIGVVGDEMSAAGESEELEGGVDGGSVMEDAFAGAGRPSSGSEAAR